MNKKAFLLVLVFLLVVSAFQPVTGLSAASEESAEPTLRIENKQLSSGESVDLNNKLNILKQQEEGTIVVRFRYTGDSIMSLFSLSNNRLANGHFHLYVSPGAIGSENRYEKPGEPQKNIHIQASNLSLKKGEVYTLAMSVDKEEGYKYFLDGELIKHDQTSPVKFLANIYEPNSAKLGITERASGGNPYPFEGDIDFFEFYSTPLSDQLLINTTEVTSKEALVNPMPDDAYITEPASLFYPGFMGSNNYRIPALFNTKENTLIAGIDRRVESGADSPNNIDAVIRRSFDEGETWDDGIVINDYPDEASNIDLAFLQDRSTERIFALVDGFPHGAGLMGGFGTNVSKGTGFKTVNGKEYMFLTDESGNEYTIREEGKVYDESGALTEYTVDMERNLYQDGEKIDNIFSETSPLKPFKTSYLELYYSDDEGETWTGPIDLNDEVKEDWMMFLGAGPGNGIQLKEGPNQGRLVFPVYFINDNNRQASAVIYSDDNGETWHRGESPNQGRIVGNDKVLDEKTFEGWQYEITEAQVVEMPDGQLKLFMRNHSGHPQIATSFDGGETWHHEVVTEEAVDAPYSQMSAIKYEGMVDGKEAVVLSSANDNSSRINGAVRFGLIKENGTYENGRLKYDFNWKYAQLVKEGHYGYSSLANLSGGKLGLFYEGTANTEMNFIKFNKEFLKWDKFREAPEPTLEAVQIISSPPPVYVKGDEIRVDVSFEDAYIMLMGERKLHGTVGGEQLTLQLEEQNKNHFTFTGTLPDLPAGIHDVKLEPAEESRWFNEYGKLYEEDILLKDEIITAKKQ
ncbi:sialidase family protein [Thalassobacillus devorans]|uniref:sialidase family protein n=1 Tax=Thalassobacillus devorans TaxID=279813 RepID=UPI001268E8BA|nr:sialidase family protein [Thalassobacillus devorans]